jgi:hypothetical protein
MKRIMLSAIACNQYPMTNLEEKGKFCLVMLRVHFAVAAKLLSISGSKALKNVPNICHDIEPYEHPVVNLQKMPISH